MSPDHVYIVLEPVGSARLTFGDDRYYQFMCFDVSEGVRSPGCDHGHDEESRNGRDIKIDILEAYVWTSESFRVKSAILPEHRGLPEPPGGLLGHSGPEERREERGEEVAARPTLLVRIGQGKGAAPPLSLFSSTSPFSPS